MSRGQWAMARVNTFLRMISGGKVKDSYRAADQDISKASDESIKSVTHKSSASFDFDEYELVIAASDLFRCNVSIAEMNGSYESEDEEEYNEMSDAQKKTLNKPFRLPSGSKKKFGVYVKSEKGNVVMVKFGDPNMEIKRDDPDRRKNFRARHQCDSNPGPKWKARYWSCRMWEGGKSVTQVTKGSFAEYTMQMDEIYSQEYLMSENPDLKEAPEMEDENEELMEYQQESVEMTMANVSSMMQKLAQIKAMVEAGGEASKEIAESWVASKLTIAEDYISSVQKYLSS
jgi:hypothetical protein